MITKYKYVSSVALVFFAVLMIGAVGCAPVSESAPIALQTELDKANAELTKLRAELEKARTEVADTKTAPLEELLRQRRSTREYADSPLTKYEVMKLLWAAQGITDGRGFRTAPSAGALYPLEIYLVAGNVDNMAPGIYKYNPVENNLTLVKEGDVRASLAAASLGQGSVANGAINIVITAVYERTEVKYGARGERYVHIEVGHVAQNICLEATALGLGLVTIGAFDDAAVSKVISMSQGESPVYVMPVGRIK
ncbi:MAG: SagB/ThcOx family dehydrogenase [Dehalococcoidia bacterium]|jgi:SagB-type dehydrogenase family enzyme